MDASLLEQVFVNLLENAAKYSPATTPIDVSVETIDDDVVVTVSDRGGGVSEDELEKIFEKFYRGRNASKNDGGVGLGLSIVEPSPQPTVERSARAFATAAEPRSA